MADETRLRTLTVSIEARTAQMEKALARIERQTSSAFGNVEKSTKRSITAVESKLQSASGTMAAFGRSLAGALAAGFSVQAAQAFIDRATRVTNALKVAGLQGDALTAVYNKLFSAAQKNAVPIEALATLYGRAAQNQKELGVSTDQLTKFTDNVALALRVAGTDANAASGALLQLGQALGSGTVHAEEFNSILEGAPTIAQAAAAGIREAGGSVAKLKQLVVEGKLSSRALFDGIAAGASTLEERAASAESTIANAFTRLENVLTDAAKKFNEVTGASEKAGGALTALAGIVEGLSNVFASAAEGPIGSFIGKLSQLNDLIKTVLPGISALGLLNEETLNDVSSKLSGWAASASDQKREALAGLYDDLEIAGPAARGTIQAQINELERDIYGNRGGPNSRGRKSVTASAPITIADYPTTGKTKKGRGGGTGAVKKTTDDAFQENLQTIRDRTAALQAERESLGATFFEQTKRQTALELEQQALKDVQDAARKKGEVDWQNVKLSPEQISAIDAVADAYARQADALRQASEMMDFQKDVLKGIFSDFRGALADGKLEWEELAQVALNALDKIIDKIEDDLIDAIFQANNAGGGGGFLSSLFGGLFGGGFSSGVMANMGTGTGLWNDGGYTGPGGKFQPAGIVHKGEYVFSSEATKAIGVAKLDSLHRLAKGYASGGYVDGSGSRLLPPANDASSASTHVTVGVSVDKNGNLQAFVKDISRQEAAGALQGYRASPQMTKDVAQHFGRARSDRNPFVR